MNKEDIGAIQQRMEVLVGLKGISFTRAAAMVCVHFGSGESDYSLHIQCAFRIREGSRILVTDTDVFSAPKAELLVRPELAYSPVDWDRQGGNRFDEWADEFGNIVMDALKVESVSISECGDLTVQTDRGIAVDVFMDVTIDECWRFFDLNSDEPHLVVCGSGLER